MTRQRKTWLVLLGASAVTAALVPFLYAQLDRLRVANEQTVFLRRQYLKLPADSFMAQAGLAQRIAELKRVEAVELARYYEGPEIDLYRFASAVNGMLERRGITVERFRTVSRSSSPVLELSARGTSFALTGFLSDVSARPRYWTIPYLHVRSPSGDGSVTCEMQIGYLVHEAAK